MSSGFQPKDQEVLTRAIKVQRLVIPFIINHNAVPASKGIGSDESSVLFLETQGDSQLVPDPNPPTPIPGLPVLGAASGFALGASAAITNTGSSVINGDVSLSPAGSITPGAWTVNGSIHNGDAAALAARNAAIAAYTDLSTRSATAIPSVLDGQSLGPGVYSETSGTFNLAASGSATLTLTGSASDIFVFQCSSTLVTGASGTPTIALVGGVTAANIFWAVGSSATINVSASGVFQGTIIAQTSITGDGGSANGRFLAGASGPGGAVTISAAMVINVPPPPGPSDSRFDLSAFDATGAFNLMVDVAAGEAPSSNGDRPIKIMQARVSNRTNGVAYPCFQNQVALAINGSQMFLNCPSGVNFASTSLDADLEIEYTVHE
jgi:hypothetical protein